MTTTNPVPSADVSDLLFNAQKLDEVVTSSLPTYTDRLGVEHMTAEGATASIRAFNSRGPWVTATLYQVRDLVIVSDIWYACVAAHTSGATFAGDAANWRVHQGATKEELADHTSASNNAGMIEIDPTLNYTVRTLGLSLYSLRRWNPMDFPWLAKFDGVTDDGPTISACALALETAGGGTVDMPGRTAYISTTIRARNGVTFEGRGDSTQLLVSTDIKVFTGDNATVNSNIASAIFRDFFINKTVTGATAEYDIYLKNPLLCRVERVHIKSGHGDTDYSATNVGGIWFEKPDAGTQGSYLNTVEDCWMQNNSVYFRNITDSVIRGGWVWGQVREFAIRLRGGGNLEVSCVNGIITSQYNGGIWLDGVSLNQVRIVNNEWDGNPLLARGDGIYCPQNVTQVTVTGNSLWGCGKNGINVVDPVGWSVTGNNFWKNNDNDNGYDDIRITGQTFQPNGNTFNGNTFTMDVARANKGYCIREVNAGFNPVNNTYKSNGVSGSANYLAGGVFLILQAEYDGTLGGIARRIARTEEFGFDTLGISPGGLRTATAGDVVAAGTLDLTVNTESFSGNPGGFSGLLTVTATRGNFPTQSRRTVYAAVGRGTTATFTSLVSQDGSGGGSAFTVTMASAGIIRFTDTSASGSVIITRMAFVGSKSAA